MQGCTRTPNVCNNVGSGGLNIPNTLDIQPITVHQDTPSAARSNGDGQSNGCANEPRGFTTEQIIGIDSSAHKQNMNTKGRKHPPQLWLILVPTASRSPNLRRYRYP